MIPALWITVKPALGDHPFVKLKVVAQNRWSLNEGSLTGTGIVTIVSLWLLSICHPVSSRTAECRQNKNCTYPLCKRQLADTVVIIGRYRLSAKQPIKKADNQLTPIIGWLSVHLCYWVLIHWLPSLYADVFLTCLTLVLFINSYLPVLLVICTYL